MEYEQNNQDGQQFTSIPAFPQFTKAFAVPLDERLGGARTDFKITQNLKAFYRFGYNYNFGVTGFGGIDLAAFANKNNTNTHVAGLDYSSSRWTHSGRFSYLNFNNFIVDANAAAGTPATLDPAGKPVLVRITGVLNDAGPDLLAPPQTFQDNQQSKYDGSVVAGGVNLFQQPLKNVIAAAQLMRPPCNRSRPRWGPNIRQRACRRSSIRCWTRKAAASSTSTNGPTAS